MTPNELRQHRAKVNYETIRDYIINYLRGGGYREYAHIMYYLDKAKVTTLSPTRVRFYIKRMVDENIMTEEAGAARSRFFTLV